jgi:hypothetical protein
MVLDASIPMGIQPVDTTQAGGQLLQNKQYAEQQARQAMLDEENRKNVAFQQQLQTEQLELNKIKMQYEQASDADKKEALEDAKLAYKLANAKTPEDMGRILQSAHKSEYTDDLINLYNSGDMGAFKNEVVGDVQAATALDIFKAPDSAATGGATGALVRDYMKETGKSFSEALYDVQTGFRQGLSKDESGNIIPIKGYAESKGYIKYGEKSGEQQAVIDTAAEIERQKKIGSGEITEVEKRDIGRAGVDKDVAILEKKYNELAELGGIIDTNKGLIQNLSASAASSDIGQELSKSIGSKTQSIRNQIKSQIPALISSIRNSTGMSAKAMDSDNELQFYLKQATSEKVDIQSNLEALKQIKNKYGSPMKNVEIKRIKFDSNGNIIQ